MEDFFYPHLSLTIDASLPAQAIPKRIDSYLLAGIFCLACFLVYRSFSIMDEMRQMGRVLDGYSIVMGSDWHDAPEPVTVTTTVYTGNRWWFGEAATETESLVSHLPTSLGTTTTVISPGLTNAQSPQSTPSFPSTHHTSTSSASSSAPVETNALLAVANFSISWPLQLDVHVALDKVLEMMGLVWQTLRKMYHYPLDPT